MTSALPRRATDLPTALRAISDLQDAIRFTPAAEWKTMDFTAVNLNTNPPFELSTSFRPPRAVSVARIMDKNTPSNRVPITGFGWQLTTDGAIAITSLTGPTAGTEYTITFKIEGER